MSNAKTVLDAVASALDIGAEAEGHIDQEFFRDVRKQFQAMRQNIEALDQALDIKLVSPTGDTYNDLCDLLKTPFQVTPLESKADSRNALLVYWEDDTVKQRQCSLAEGNSFLEHTKKREGSELGRLLVFQDFVDPIKDQGIYPNLRTVIENTQERVRQLGSVRQAMNKRDVAMDPALRAKLYAVSADLGLFSAQE